MTGRVWCAQVDNFFQRLSDSYYCNRRGLKILRKGQTAIPAPEMDETMLWVVHLWQGFQAHFLPANCNAGLGGQNPRLLEAFRYLAAAEAKVREEENFSR